MQNTTNENLPPTIIKQIIKEIRDLVTSPIDGIKVTANEEDVSDIQAVIDGPEETPFFGGSFKVKLVLGSDFPQAPPKAYFLTKIFHPNVSAKGEICVNTIKKDWNPQKGLRHIFLAIRCLMIEPNPESALNEEAGKLLLERYDDYCKHAKLMTSIHAVKKTNPQPVPVDEQTPANKKRATVSENNNANNNTSTSTNSSNSTTTTAVPQSKKSLKRL